MEVNVVPYLASYRWYEEWFRMRAGGATDNTPVTAANRSLSLSGKDFARTMIKNRDSSLLLSLPIEGGSAELKKKAGLEEAIISEHGHWRRMHLGAIEANYGKTPFFIHLFPIISRLYASGEKSLAVFNMELHEALVSFLLAGETGAFPLSSAVRSRGEEIAARIDTDLSIIDAVMRYGQETTLALLARK